MLDKTILRRETEREEDKRHGVMETRRLYQEDVIMTPTSSSSRRTQQHSCLTKYRKHMATAGWGIGPGWPGSGVGRGGWVGAGVLSRLGRARRSRKSQSGQTLMSVYTNETCVDSSS